MTTARGAYGASLLALVLLGACSGRGTSAQADDAATATGGNSDASSSPIDGQHGPDGGAWCPGPLGDAGFSSLADLPVASLCAQSEASGDNEVYESTIPCQGFTIVRINIGADCGGWWLFDAAGALVAEGGSCPSPDAVQCTGAVPGLDLPYQCFLNGGWPQSVNLCPDGGVDGGSLDAARDAADSSDASAAD